jgi:hypothetical protein
MSVIPTTLYLSAIVTVICGILIASIDYDLGKQWIWFGIGIAIASGIAGTIEGEL